MTVLSSLSLISLFGDSPAIQPASIDLHLGDRMLGRPINLIDPEDDQCSEWRNVSPLTSGRFFLAQNQLYLGVTEERIAIPPDCVGMLHGVSSLGRLGLLVHVTAGLADPGWEGRLTLELVSLGGPILLRPGMRIGQLTLHKLDQVPPALYAGKYQGDHDPEPSRMWREVAG